jgi:hypothetical protein
MEIFKSSFPFWECKNRGAGFYTQKYFQNYFYGCSEIVKKMASLLTIRINYSIGFSHQVAVNGIWKNSCI